MSTNPSRYQDDPFLRLLECYVLEAIGQLDPKEEQSLVALEPKLQSIYQLRGDWKSIVAQVMDLPKKLPEKIRAMWEQNTELARKHRTELPPQQFAEMFVDQNLGE